MSRYGRYMSWISSKARIDAEANDGHLSESLFKRPKVQAGGRSKSVRVQFKRHTPAAPQSLYKPERPDQEDEAQTLLPLANPKSVHYKPGEPPTNKQTSKPRKSGPDTQPFLSTTPATEGLQRSKSVRAFYPPIHKSSSTPNVQSGSFIDHSYKRGELAPQLSRGLQGLTRTPSNITREPPMPRPNFRLYSGALTESEAHRRLNRDTSGYGPSTAVPPLYSTSIEAPPAPPIPGVTVITPVNGVISPELAGTQTMSPVASTKSALPPARIRPLPPIPKLFAVSPPVASKDISFGPHPACPPEHQRRRALPVSTDEIDYREVITAILENDNPAFHDYSDWRLQHPRDEQQGNPSDLFSGARLTSFIWIE